MQWLVALETDSDPISICRLLNIFRRKGVKVVTLALAARPAGFSLLSVVESPESEVEHIFNFLRRTEGVRQVTYYRHETSGQPSYVFVVADEHTSTVARILQTFPEAKLVFANHGKYLLEIPAESASRWTGLGFGQADFLPLARVKTSSSVAQPEPVGTLLER